MQLGSDGKRMSSYQATMEKPKPVRLMALGRPFRLGMLYDLRSHNLISDATLLDNKYLQENVVKTPYRTTNLTFISHDNFHTKANQLILDSNMMLNIICNLVEISGSANYVNDRQRTNHQSRMVLKYLMTTHFEQLSVAHLGREFELQNQDIATHIVTAITHGADAFFIFDRKVGLDENKEEIDAKVSTAVKKLPSWSIDLNGNIVVEEQDKDVVDKLQCTFYGDYNLKQHPSTFQDAVMLYQELPDLLGADGEHAVPKTVWLYPLHLLLDSKPATIIYELPDFLVNQALVITEDLHSSKVKASDLTRSPAFQYFSHLKEQLLKFIEIMDAYENKIRREMAVILLQIRSGQAAAVQELDKIFANVETSPFSQQTLSKWLEDKQDEIEHLDSLVRNINQSTSSSAIEWCSVAEVVNTADLKYILCLSFRLNEEDEPQLREMSNYFDRKGAFLRTEAQKPVSWTKNVPTAAAVTPGSITLQWSNEERGSEGVEKYQIFYQIQGTDEWQGCSTIDSRKIAILGNLPPATSFQFAVQSVDEICLSAFSEISEWITTAPVPELSSQVKTLLKKLKSNKGDDDKDDDERRFVFDIDYLTLAEASAICEALKPVSPKYMAITCKYISMESLERIVDSLKTNMRVEGIGFGKEHYGDEEDNRLIPVCGRNLADALKVNKRIEYLLFTNTGLTDDDFQLITDELKKNETDLKGLYMEKNPLLTSRSARNLRQLVEVTRKLEEIYLSGSNLNDDWAIEIALAMKVNTTVKELSIRDCKIGDESVKLFGEMLEVNRTLKELILGGSQMTNVGLKYLADGLKKNDSTLELLYLGGKQLSKNSEGGKALMEAKSEKLDLEIWV
ncbi:unnamed protein product [Didymodactylos carnosus]|uniref:Fibronectin type-III domain-containing protein n=1 Tax=Didymodactylos carnosus TaxID=1234261 RepID=A0A8S2HJS1_9BILA|nr:unnamed protein product [Didymodactylos carnosus]CAF3649657.1 unnamed protein product [Didymodactylos carnosus]